MIRKYTQTDQERVIELLQSNTPIYFDLSEEAIFVNYLNHKTEDYFVYEKGTDIIACGGINYFNEEYTARLSWDMVHVNYHKKGIGKELTQFRINHLRHHPNIKQVIVRTTQLVHPFYKKMGFHLEEIKKDYWAKGFDLYLMSLSLWNVYIY